MSNEGKQNSESDSGADFGMTGGEESIVFGDVIERMEELHFKLCTSFRCAVKFAFSSHGDVLDAGGAVQVTCLSCPYPLKSYFCGPGIDA